PLLGHERHERGEADRVVLLLPLLRPDRRPDHARHHRAVAVLPLPRDARAAAPARRPERPPRRPGGGALGRARGQLLGAARPVPVLRGGLGGGPLPVRYLAAVRLQGAPRLRPSLRALADL